MTCMTQHSIGDLHVNVTDTGGFSLRQVPKLKTRYKRHHRIDVQDCCGTACHSTDSDSKHIGGSIGSKEGE